MKQASVIFASLVALISLGSPAKAQLAPGYSGYSSAPREGTNVDYWRLIRRLGSCLSNSKAEASLDFLSTTPGTASEGEAWDGLFKNRRANICMRGFASASMARSHVRGSIAQAIFLRSLDEDESPYSPQLRPVSSVSGIHDFADCYVAGHYSTAKALVSETRLSSEGEFEFVKTMASGFGPCLPDGAEVEIEPTAVRLAIAEALYRTIPGAMRPGLSEGAQ